MEALFRTHASLAPLILRIGLGIVIFPHGAQKLLGWFGGHGLAATLRQFRDQLQIPVPLALLAILAESLGSLALIVGFVARLAALGIGITMLVAAYTVHVQFGFFMNWFGEKKGHGVEYHLLIIAMCASLIITGAGAASLDRFVASWLRHG
jgi:putative oxidoreductase